MKQFEVLQKWGRSKNELGMTIWSRSSVSKSQPRLFPIANHDPQ
jgi:hypothetical protein